MITLVENSNILDVKEGIILHGVNCQGVMGSGVAKQIRAKYPEVFEQYYRFYAEYAHVKEELLGEVILVDVFPGLSVANCFTQLFYGNDGLQYASYDAVDACLENIDDMLGNTYDTPLHIPYLIGCGKGGLRNSIVMAIIEERLGRRTVYLHKPY